MTKLERLTGKLFGETASPSGDDPEIGQFGSALAGTYNGTADVATIQSLPAWSNGFIGAVTPSTQYPPLPEMTGFGKVLSYQQNYILQQGIPEWDSGTTYYINNFCSKGDRLFISLTDSNTNNNPETDLVNWKEFKPGSSSRNIGEIVHSLIPLTDAGLHLLDGTLIQGTGIYEAFVNYMATLYGDGSDVPSYFTTEADWQTSVATYGVCGKFVYDSVNSTLRLPRVTGIMEGTIDETALGDLVQAGLPNIRGAIGDINQGYGYVSGAFTRNSYLPPNKYNDITANVPAIEFAASSYNSIYKDNVNTVQPQTVKGFIYIVVANIAKTEIEVDIDEIATDLNGKLDVDFNNAPSTLADSFLASLTPDWTNKETKLNYTQYTASSAGYVYAYGFTQSEQIAIIINGTTYTIGGRGDQYGGGVCCFIPVNKNDTYLTTGNVSSLIFIPLKGAN